MGVYVKLLLRSLRSERKVEVKGVVNTGFRSPNPDIILPVARQLDLYPPPDNSYEAEAETGGGPTLVYVAPRAVTVSVVSEDKDLGR